jgi:hypothetical protein
MLAGPILTPVVFLEDKAFSAKWPALTGRPRLRLESPFILGLRAPPTNPLPRLNQARRGFKPSRIRGMKFRLSRDSTFRWRNTMNLILLIASAAEIAIATIILWYVVDLLTTMPANMRMVVKYLIVLVAILVVISMFVGQPIHVGFLPSPAPIIR